MIAADPDEWRRQMAECAAEMGVRSPWEAP